MPIQDLKMMITYFSMEICTMLTGWMNHSQCHHHLKAHHHRKRSLVVRHSRRQCAHLQATVYLFGHLCQSAPIQIATQILSAYKNTIRQFLSLSHQPNSPQVRIKCFVHYTVHVALISARGPHQCNTDSTTA